MSRVSSFVCGRSRYLQVALRRQLVAEDADRVQLLFVNGGATLQSLPNMQAEATESHRKRKVPSYCARDEKKCFVLLGAHPHSSLFPAPRSP